MSLLVHDDFLQVSKALIRYLEGDVVQAVVLTELSWLSYCFRETDQMKYSDGWFFRTSKDLERDLCISYHKQSVAISKLEEKKFIKTRLAGRPAKQYFKVNDEYIKSVIEDSSYKEEAEAPSETKQDRFYRELNEATQKGFEVFKTKTDNLKKPFAAFMYTWNQLYYEATNSHWMWSPRTVGMLNTWYTRNIASGDVDFSRLYDFFLSSVSIGNAPEKYIDMWIKYDKSNFEKAPSERVIDPRRYWR